MTNGASMKSTEVYFMILAMGPDLEHVETKKMFDTENLKLGCKLLTDIKNAAVSATNHIKQLAAKFEDGQMSTSKGISFLEVKNHTMLSYMANIIHLANLKCHGQSIKDDPSIGRLVEIRTVLEKMRPIDQKIKYQVDKLLKTAATGIGENDPLRFKPNPGNLVSKLGNESGSDEGDDAEGDDDKVYKPPKLAAMHYDGDETEKEKLEKKKERQMKQALSSSIMRDLKQQYTDAPEEITDSVGEYKRTQNKQDKERQDYEEKYFVRKVLSRKEKHAMTTQNRKTGLEDITRFGAIGAITGDDEDERPSKKRRLSSGKKSGKKGAKKKKFRK